MPEHGETLQSVKEAVRGEATGMIRQLPQPHEATAKSTLMSLREQHTIPPTGREAQLAKEAATPAEKRWLSEYKQSWWYTLDTKGVKADAEEKESFYRKLAEERARDGKSVRLMELYARSYANDAKGERTNPQYTPEEACMLYEGWQAYLKTYGEHGSYSFAEIMNCPQPGTGEKPSAEAIKEAIGQGLVTDPRAIQLYGLRELEQTRAYYERTIAKLEEDPELAPEAARLRENAAIFLPAAEKDLAPLIAGDYSAFALFSIRQMRAHRHRENKYNTLTDAERTKYPDAAASWDREKAQNEEQVANWSAMTEQILTQPPIEGSQPLTGAQLNVLRYLQNHPGEFAVQTLTTLQPEGMRSLIDTVNVMLRDQQPETALPRLNPDNMQNLTATIRQVKAKEALQAEGEQAPAKSDLIDLLLALIQGVKDGMSSAATSAIKEALPDNQQNTR